MLGTVIYSKSSKFLNYILSVVNSENIKQASIISLKEQVRILKIIDHLVTELEVL